MFQNIDESTINFEKNNKNKLNIFSNVLEKKNIGKPAKKKWYEEEDEPKKTKAKDTKKVVKKK